VLLDWRSRQSKKERVDTGSGQGKAGERVRDGDGKASLGSDQSGVRVGHE